MQFKLLIHQADMTGKPNGKQMERNMAVTFRVRQLFDESVNDLHSAGGWPSKSRFMTDTCRPEYHGQTTSFYHPLVSQDELV